MAYTDNIIPTMTSNTAPDGVASSSSEYSSGMAAWKAFDKSNVDSVCWHSSDEAFPKALQYQFAAAKTITRYAITTRNVVDPLPPSSWTFQGSNDGATWTTLDTQTDITDWMTGGNTRKVFDFANSTAYLYCRLYVTAGKAETTYLAVGELEMMEGYPTPLRSIGSGIGSGIASGIA